MRILSNVLKFLPIIGTLVSCASPGIRIYSEPGSAEVFVIEANQAPKKLGTTPLNLDERDFNWGQANGVQLRFVKEGFKSESIVLPKTRFASNSSIHALMDKAEASLAQQSQGEALRKIADAVAKSQNYIYKNQYDRAQMLLENLTIDYPNLSVLYDLLGNVYYLRKDLRSSLTAYRKSESLWPNNRETKKMIRRIENVLGNESQGTGS